MPSSVILVQCPNCKHKFPPEEALSHALRETWEKENTQKHQVEIKEAERKAAADAIREIKEKSEIEAQNLKKEAFEEKERNKKLLDQITSLAQDVRKANRRAEEADVNAAKKIAEEEDKIRQEAVRKAEESHRYKDLEYEKKLQDTLKINEELKRRIEQGSQQTQGEVMELELEAVLRSEFPSDEITEVAKGVRGADIAQTVVDAYGRQCGVILWESKNAKWNNAWIDKLKADQQVAKAQMAVLVTAHLPEDINNFTFDKGKKIWITNTASVIGLAWAIRINIAQLYAAKLASVGKNEKMEVLYGYLTGPEFVHRVEAIMGAFRSLKGDLEKEKKWFMSKWSRQEKEIGKIMENTQGMYGDLQGVTDRSLPEIKILELEDGE